MLSDETKSLIHLSLIRGVGNQTIRCLLRAFASAQKALTAASEELAQVDGLTPAIRQRIVGGREDVSIDRELQLIQTHGCQVVTIHDESYPSLLKQIADSPPLLYIKGKLPPENTLNIAVVGSRSPTDYGKTICHQLSYQLAAKGITVVSGFARGLDTCAHRGALDAKGRTIGVLGNGLSLVYPEENRGLADDIVESGALISEFPMTMPPIARNFPRRNRVISGLTWGTLVVEASDRSGALITARFAAEQGREVFAVPGQVFSKLSRGTHQLINQGAHLINTVDDLLDALPTHCLELPRLSSTAQPPKESQVQSVVNHTPTQATQPTPAPALQLSADEQAVLAAIDSPSSHIDQIARIAKLPINKVSGTLVMLELKEIIQQLPGKRYVKK